jgi:hypothetical protein
MTMMFRTLWVVLLGVLLGAFPGCAKKSGKGQPGVEKKTAGAGSVEGAARGLVEAAARRDQVGVLRLLMNDTVCEAQPDMAAGCRKYVKALRSMVPEMMRGVPKSFKVARVEVKDLQSAGDKRVRLAMVHPKGGGNPVPLMVMEYRKRFYVGVGIKPDSKQKK